MTLLEIFLDLMMILIFLTGTGVLVDIFDGLHMPWGSYVWNLVEICWVWRHQDNPQRLMTLLQLLLESMMIMDIPDRGCCPWWRFGWSSYALRKLCLKFGWNLLSLKVSRMVSKMEDIAGSLEDAGGSWLVLMSLIRIGMCGCADSKAAQSPSYPAPSLRASWLLPPTPYSRLSVSLGDLTLWLQHDSGIRGNSGAG